MSEPSDIVRVHNIGEQTLRLRYNNKVTVIEPGQDSIVARENAILHFGNPDASPDRPAKNRSIYNAREEEYHRLRGRYGAAEGKDDAGEYWDKRPRVKVYEQDGTEWVTVLDDPKGEKMPVKGAPKISAEEEMAFLRKRMQALEQRYNNPQAATVSDVPEDTAEFAPPRKRGRPAKVQAAIPEDFEESPDVVAEEA